jgi:hypothetical protein
MHHQWLVVDRFYPFAIRMISREGGVKRLPTTDLERVAKQPRSEIDKLVAISVVALDGSILLTLGELTSSRRALVTFDCLRGAQRYREIDAPLAFVASSEHRVVAVRRLSGYQVLVRYQWGWVDAPLLFPQ